MCVVMLYFILFFESVIYKIQNTKFKGYTVKNIPVIPYPNLLASQMRENTIHFFGVEPFCLSHRLRVVGIFVHYNSQQTFET
jgi:hypothetical protein